MNNMKKIIIALGITVLLYGLVGYIYNTYIKEPYQSVYVLNRDLAKNEDIKEEYLREIKTVRFSNNKEYISKTELLKGKGNIVAAYSIRAGQILTNDVIARKEDKLDSKDGWEYISLDIKGASTGVSYQVKKGSVVNIYYTARAKTVEGILGAKEKIYSSNSIESNITCKLLDNVEIVGIYNSKGIGNIKSPNEGSDSETTFDTVVISVNTKDALLISNLKQQGEFNLTMVSK